MAYFVHIVILAVCTLGLWFGAVWVVDSASRIAKKLGMSELVIGLTIVAIATSAPEFAVSISAALRGQEAISVGNIVGSNIFNLGIILGLVAISQPLIIEKKLLHRDGALLFGATLLLIIFFRDLQLSFFEGVIMSGILVGYIIWLVREKEEALEEVPAGEFKWLDIPMLILGAGIIIVSANFLVSSASELARMMGVSEWLIGITIVGAGTSTPELATSIVALKKGKVGISAGNLIGSDIFNMLGVLGVASILHPLNITVSEIHSLMIMSAFVLLLLVFFRTGWKLTRLEGILLIAVGIFRWIIDFVI